jgi:polyisoprenoid-binding protein YceI
MSVTIHPPVLMRVIQTMRFLCAVLISLALSPAVFARGLDAERSTINYLSIKKGTVAEVGRFDTFNASLSDGGELKLEIDLSSVNSNIAQRDQRMRDFLFEVARFPVATVKAQLAMAPLLELGVGEELALDVNGRLHLHGVAHPVTASLRVQRLADGALRASTVAPIILNTDDFALQDGLEKLRSLASLPSIDSVAPVFFSLVFKP